MIRVSIARDDRREDAHVLRVVGIDCGTFFLVDGLDTRGTAAHRPITRAIGVEPRFVFAGAKIGDVGRFLQAVQVIRDAGAVARKREPLIERSGALTLGRTKDSLEKEIAADAIFRVEIDEAAVRACAVAIETLRVADVLRGRSVRENDGPALQHLQRKSIVRGFIDDDRIQNAREYLLAARRCVQRR